MISALRRRDRPQQTQAVSSLGKIAGGSVIALGGAVINTALTYVHGVAIGRFLGAEALGLFFLAFGVIQVLTALSRVGLAEGLLRFVPIQAVRGDVSAVKGSVIFALSVVAGVSSFAAIGLLLCAEPVAVTWFHQPALAVYLRLAAACLPPLTVSQVALVAIQALRRMDLVVIPRDVLQPGLMLMLTLVLLVTAGGLAGVFVAYLVSAVAATAVALYLLRHKFAEFFSVRTLTVPWKGLLVFSLPVVASDLAYYSFRWVDTLILSLYRPPADTGVYNAALRTTLLLNLLPVALASLYGPTVAELHQSGRTAELQALVRTVLRWGLSAALPVLATMWLLGPDVMALWGPEFVDGTTVLALLAGGQFLAAGSGVLAPTILLSGRQYLETANVVGQVLITLVANLVLDPPYGALGAAVALAVVQAWILVVRIVEVQFVLKLDLASTNYLKPLLAIIPAAIVVLLGRQLLDIIPYQAGLSLVRLGVLSLLLAFGYVLALSWIGLEREDLLIWRDFRQRLGWAGN